MGKSLKRFSDPHWRKAHLKIIKRENHFRDDSILRRRLTGMKLDRPIIDYLYDVARMESAITDKMLGSLPKEEITE